MNCETKAKKRKDEKSIFKLSIINEIREHNNTDSPKKVKRHKNTHVATTDLPTIWNESSLIFIK